MQKIFCLAELTRQQGLNIEVLGDVQDISLGI